MSDVTDEAPVTEPTEAPAGSAEPQQDTPQPPQHDWEQRYKDTQSWGQKAHDTLNDPEKLQAFLEENHPDWFEADAPTEEPVAVTEDPTPDSRVDELMEWRKQQDQLRYEQDLDKALAGRELDEQGVAWLAHQFQTHGFNPDTVNKAVNDWFDYLDSKAAPKPPPATPPHVPTGGQAPDGPDTPPAEMTASQYAKWAADQLRAEAA